MSVLVSLTNHSPVPLNESPARVFLIAPDGSRIQALPLTEATTGAGGPRHLLANVRGSWTGVPRSEQQTVKELRSLMLQPTVVMPGATQSGYAFFPAGNYQGFAAVLNDNSSGGSISVTNSF